MQSVGLRQYKMRKESAAEGRVCSSNTKGELKEASRFVDEAIESSQQQPSSPCIITSSRTKRRGPGVSLPSAAAEGAARWRAAGKEKGRRH